MNVFKKFSRLILNFVLNKQNKITYRPTMIKTIYHFFVLFLIGDFSYFLNPFYRE